MINKNLNWEHIKTFLYVLRLGSFSSAANELGLKQSTISRQIEALEKQLGFPLFTRSQKGVRPTDSALRLRPHLNIFSAAADSLVRDVLSDEGEISGTIRITTNEPLGIEILPKSLVKLKHAFPLLNFEISMTEKAVDLLSREADIAIRVGKTTQKAILAKRVGFLEMGLHGSKTYLNGRKRPENLKDLTNHTIIGFDSLTERAIRVMDLPDIFQKNNLTYSTDSSALHIELVDKGCGLGLCFVNANRPERIRVLQELIQFRADVWLAMHEDLKTSKKFRSVFKELSEIIKVELNSANSIL